MPMRRWMLVVVVSLMLQFVGVVRAVPNWSQPVFGAVEAGVRPEEALQLGVSWERLPFDWHRFQPNGPDDFDTNAISNDALMRAQAAGRQVVGLIKNTPVWASDSGSPAAVPRGLDLPYDDPENTFAQFVTRLVGHYSQQGIHHWVIWNEPDIRPGEGHLEFEGEVEDYFHMLKSGYLAARSVDRRAHIQIAGLTWWYDSERGREPYLQRLLQVISDDPDARQNGWYFDGVSMHIYFTTSSVAWLPGAYRSILGQYGLGGKQIWLSEFNASPRRDPAAAIGAPFNVSLEQQADFIVQASALALAANVDRLAVYKLYDSNFTPGQTEPWGLVRADGSLRPAFNAYQQVIADFQNAHTVRQYSSDSATVIAVQVGNRTVHVMWNDTFESGEFLFYSGGSEVAVSDAQGNQWSQPVEASGAAVIDAPGAEKIDMDFVVVAGPVRMVTLSGGIRRIAFRNAAGTVTPLTG